MVIACAALSLVAFWYVVAATSMVFDQEPSAAGLSVEGPCAPIDFETVPPNASAEGLLIDHQFAASHGITFRLEPQGSPRLAEVGAPMTAFEGPGRAPDMPAPIK